MIAAARAAELVRQFRRRRVLVLGDLMLDRYLWGNAERISPEAPVPVVRVERESIMLGGAGNVARNLASLGAEVHVVGVVGEDGAAAELERLFERWKIDVGGLVRSPDRPTTEKTRILARAQQMVRYDRESEEPAEPELVEQLLAAVRRVAAQVDAAILQDYGKGVLSHDVTLEAMRIFRAASVRVFVDPKKLSWDAYRGAELVKPNLREAEDAAGMRVRDEEDIAALGRRLLDLCDGATVAITRGGEGITLFSREAGMRHVPTRPFAVADVAGAGDTAIAALALARLAGASWEEAAALANAAAGVVVGVPGTATISPDELIAAAQGAP